MGMSVFVEIYNAGLLAQTISDHIVANETEALIKANELKIKNAMKKCGSIIDDFTEKQESLRLMRR